MTIFTQTVRRVRQGRMTRPLSSRLIDLSACLLSCLPLLSLQAAPINDIQVVSGGGFHNFERVHLTIDVPAYAMNGQYRFIKIFDDFNNTLFIGAVSPFETFSVPVHALKTADKITVQLFSENAADEPVVLSAHLK